MSRNELRVPVAAILLTATFVTALVTAQVISAKLFVVTLPLLGAVAAPGGTIAYAATFFASDCLAELYGERYTRRVVNVTFGMNFLLLALVFLTIELPAARGSVDPTAFATVLGLSGNVVAGSLAAYLLSQNWDVFVFGRLRDATNGRLLWLRNLGSTATSQLIDTVVFTVVPENDRERLGAIREGPRTTGRRDRTRGTQGLQYRPSGEHRSRGRVTVDEFVSTDGASLFQCERGE